ncbi:hypothetical protein [Aporhodopirellula aestuarii]|uniref:Uncharacterized protein n=1 Tax=Aporhodopirellula aestuarii TaxID=2950107 RepID=A0ABT0U135_9BACT|nr:hypothetical protein [Aporhodopirellula aestuarii]MCM2370591.1 hypothetical protein [Aporhodopirellula aestuarii]
MSEPSPEILEEIRDLLLRGRKLEAVKVYRTAEHSSLLDAKNAVEDLERELKASSPESFLVNSKTGCAGAFLLVAVALKAGITLLCA